MNHTGVMNESVTINLSANMNRTEELREGNCRLLQPVWDIFLRYEAYTTRPLFMPLFLLSFFTIITALSMGLDKAGRHISWLRKYKLQPDKDVTYPQIQNAVKLLLWNNSVYLLPILMAQYVWGPPNVLPKVAPSLWDFVWQQVVCLYMFDTFYWIIHTTLHKVRFLYKKIHFVHHQYSSPFGLTSQYLHPYEFLTISLFAFLTPWILRVFVPVHFMTEFGFALLNIWVAIEDHCGYELPYNPLTLLPFYGGGPAHDMHHMRPLTNFQPHFTWGDRLFGWYCPHMKAGGKKTAELLKWEIKNKGDTTNADQLSFAESLLKEGVLEEKKKK